MSMHIHGSEFGDSGVGKKKGQSYNPDIAFDKIFAEIEKEIGKTEDGKTSLSDSVKAAQKSNPSKSVGEIGAGIVVSTVKYDTPKAINSLNNAVTEAINRVDGIA